MSMHFTNKYYLICEYVLKQKKKKEGKKRKNSDEEKEKYYHKDIYFKECCILRNSNGRQHYKMIAQYKLYVNFLICNRKKLYMESNTQQRNI